AAGIWEQVNRQRKKRHKGQNSKQKPGNRGADNKIEYDSQQYQCCGHCSGHADIVEYLCRVRITWDMSSSDPFGEVNADPRQAAPDNASKASQNVSGGAHSSDPTCCHENLQA